MAKKLVVQQKKKHSIGDTLEIVDVLPVTTAKAVIEYEGDATVDHATQRKTARRFVNDDEKDAIAEIPHNVYIDDDPYPQPASGTIRNNSLDLFGIASTEMLEDKFNKIDSHLPTLGVFEVPPTTNYDHYVHVLTISPDACAEILNSTGSIKIAISGNGLRYTEIIFGTRVATLRRFNMYITDTTSYGRISAYHVDDKLKLVVKLQDPDTPTNTPLYLHSVVSTNNRATYQVEMTELEQVNFLGEIKKYTYANISSATLTSPGLMTAEDKRSLNGIIDSIYYNRDIMQVATGTSLKNGNSIASAIASWLNGQETPQYDFIYKIYEQDTTQKNIATLYPIFYYNGGAEHQVEYICYSIYGVGKINIYAVQGGSPEYSYTDILPSDLYERFDNGYASIGITGGENVTLTTGDQGRIELISDSVVIETNSGYDYSPTLDKEVANKGYVDKHTLSLRKEIASLKEMTASQINLESTSVNVEDGGVVPQIVNVDGQDYNVVPKGDVSVLSVEGDSVSGKNVLHYQYVTDGGIGFTCTFENGTFVLNGTLKKTMFIFFKDTTFDGTQYSFKNFGTYQSILLIPDRSAFSSGETKIVRAGTSQPYFQINSGTFHNDTIKPILVKGTQAPTQFQPYFEGLKHTEYENVTISSPNLYSGNKRITITQGTEKWSYISTSQLKAMGLVVGERYAFKIFDAPSGIVCQHLPSYNYNNYNFVFDESTSLRIGHNSVAQTVSFDTKLMLVKGSTIPTEFIPYYSTPILQTPTQLSGVEGYRDTLEVRLNEDTLLYDVYKITKCKTITFNGKASENWGMQDTVSDAWRFRWDGTVLGAKNNRPNDDDVISVSSYEDVSANQGWTGRNGVSFDAGGMLFVTNLNTPSIDSFRSWLSSNPLTVTYALATPTETLIKSNLTFDQVTALAHTLSNIDIVDSNNVYLTKPRVNLGLVYKKVIS